jgi:hypothetical protein
MPPFPGNEKELDALTAFILDAQQNLTPIKGAQTIGIPRLPDFGSKKKGDSDSKKDTVQ